MSTNASFNDSFPAMLYRQLKLKQPFPSPSLDLAGKVYLITGANAGLGFEAARQLLGLNADVVLVARDQTKADDARQKLLEEFTISEESARVKAMACDLRSFAAVVEFCGKVETEVPRLDVAVMNAGLSKTTWTTTGDGYETQLQVNFLSTALMSLLLLPMLRRSISPEHTPRLILVTSEGHAWTTFPARNSPSILSHLNTQSNFDPNTVYADSKLLLTMFALSLSERVHDVSVILTTPSFCYSGLSREVDNQWVVRAVYKLFAKTPQEGARALTWPATCEDETARAAHGGYLVFGERKPTAKATTGSEGERNRQRVWEEFLKLAEKIKPGVSEGVEEES